MNKRTQDTLGGIGAAAIVTGFATGIIMAVAHNNVWWLVLTAICWLILSGG